MTYVSALRTGGICAAMALLSTVAGGALAAPKIVPKIVPRPAAGATCHVPSSADTQFFQLPAKTGPCRVALADGCIANTWRIQLIQTAKACAAQPEVATDLKKLMVVSTGEDVAAQISAINTFIEPGYDAIMVNARNPQAFTPVIKRAKQASVVLAAFDNTLDPKNAIDVNVDQTGIGTLSADWLIDHIANGGKVPEVRGVIGTSVNTDRHNGTHDALAASGKNWDIVGVVGKWDDGVAHKADAIAVHGHFDGIAAQGGDTGVVQAMIDAGHPFVPFAGETETETGLRKFCGAHEAEGPVCFCAGAGPAQVAAAIKTSIDALKGKAPPRSARLPLAIVQAPTFKDGENYSSAQSDNFCVGNVFPACGINFTAQGNMRQDQKNQRRPTLDHRRRRKVAAAD